MMPCTLADGTSCPLPAAFLYVLHEGEETEKRRARCADHRIADLGLSANWGWSEKKIPQSVHSRDVTTDRDTETAELLAIMAAPLPAGETFTAPPTQYEVVKRFAKDNELEPGAILSIQACSLFRMYEHWHAARLPDHPQVSPLGFCKQVKRLGYERSRVRTIGERMRSSYHLGMRKQAADRCKAWLESHPDPEGYRQWFKAQFIHKRQPQTEPAP